MLQHVYERAQKSRYLDDLLVATDDQRIAAAVRQFGGRVRMTRDDHPSGTDRLAEIASSEQAALYVNIQGDEPLIDPEAIDAAILSLHGDDSIPMGTLKKRIVDPTDIVNTNVVKVVTNLLNDAIYFSRCPIPYERDGSQRIAALLEAHRAICLSARLSAAVSRFDRRPARTLRASRAVASH